MSIVITASTSPVIVNLENLGFPRDISEKLVSKIEETEYDTLLDAAGRLVKYAEVRAADVPRLYHLLHSQNPRNNYGGLKELGVEKIPESLTKLTRYLAVYLKPLLPPQEENETAAIEVENVSIPNISATATEIVETVSMPNIEIKEETPTSIPVIAADEENSNSEHYPTAAVDAYREIIYYLLEKMPKAAKKEILMSLVSELD